LAEAAIAIQDRVQCPIAICAQSVLAAATLAVQALADIELPHHAVRPISNYFLTIAGTGERKSACDDLALKALRDREDDLRVFYDAEMVAFERDKLAWDKARDNATKQRNADRAAIRVALDAVGDPPPEPLKPFLTCEEPNLPGLHKLFLVGQPSMGIFSAEGGHFIGGHGMSEEHKLMTAAGLSAFWDGAAVKRVRAGDGATHNSLYPIPRPVIGRATSAAAYIASISSRERCALPRNLPRHGRPRSAVLAISMASDIGSTTSISSRSRLIMSMSAPASHL
jgi:hypothetical protein